MKLFCLKPPYKALNSKDFHTVSVEREYNSDEFIRCLFLVQIEKKLSFLHRSRVDIMANVLQESIGGAKKTHIMYNCNLSFKQLQTYLELLIERELLEIKSEGKGNSGGFYEITQKGRAFLRSYHSIKILLGVAS